MIDGYRRICGLELITVGYPLSFTFKAFTTHPIGVKKDYVELKHCL